MSLNPGALFQSYGNLYDISDTMYGECIHSL